LQIADLFWLLQVMEIDAHVDFYGLMFLPGFFRVPYIRHVTAMGSVLLFHSFGSIGTDGFLYPFKRRFVSFGITAHRDSSTP